MDFLLSNPTFDQAEQYYQTALEEYARPEEDVVPYMVCESAYKAVIQYLKGYIQAYGRDTLHTDSHKMLLHECRIINPHFYELNLKVFDQKDKNDDVLMDMSIVHRYINIAAQTRKLVGMS